MMSLKKSDIIKDELRIWDVIKQLEDKKISRVRMNTWITWTEELLFLWKHPDKILIESCDNKEDYKELIDFLRKIEDNEKYWFEDIFHNILK